MKVFRTPSLKYRKSTWPVQEDNWKCARGKNYLCGNSLAPLMQDLDYDRPLQLCVSEDEPNLPTTHYAKFRLAGEIYAWNKSLNFTGWQGVRRREIYYSLTMLLERCNVMSGYMWIEQV